MMTKRRRIAFASVVATVLALTAWFVLHAREPEYQKKKLNQWLRQLEMAQDIESTEWQGSAHALRQMGTNTLPWLIAPLRTSDPQWKAQTVEWFRDVLNKDF